MLFPETALIVVTGFMVLANRLVAAFFTPLFERFGWDRQYLFYVAWIVAGILVWFTGLNLFADYIAIPVVGQILTSIIAGGGANILHDLSTR